MKSLKCCQPWVTEKKKSFNIHASGHGRSTIHHAFYLSQSLADLGLEVAILEGDVGAAEVGVLEGSLGRLGHRVPVGDGVGLAHGVRELQLVVGGEGGEVFDLGAVALHLGHAAGGLAVAAVAGGGRADDLGGRRVRVVDLDDDVLEVVYGPRSVTGSPKDGVHG